MSTGLKSQQGTVIRTGEIAAICYSEELVDGVRKEAHEEAQVTSWGIPGDRHYGEMRYSGRARKQVPNNRPITVFGAESARDVCEKLAIPLVQPGGFGENFLTEGLGDLSDAQPGDEIHITGANGTPNVVLHVQGQNDPCANLSIYHKLMVKELYGRRGLLCTVLQEGTARVGDKVELVRP